MPGFTDVLSAGATARGTTKTVFYLCSELLEILSCSESELEDTDSDSNQDEPVNFDDSHRTMSPAYIKLDKHDIQFV